MEASIGALWVKESFKGAKFLSGNVEVDGVKHYIVVFKNTLKKEGEKSPDWRIYASKPRPEPTEDERPPIDSDDEDLKF